MNFAHHFEALMQMLTMEKNRSLAVPVNDLKKPQIY